jgi:putative ATPase
MIAGSAQAEFISISAVLSGVKDIRAAVDSAQRLRREQGRATVLFVDEVHRFNKSQQDAFLPFVEDGTLTFIGATTENPSFELNNALLSRARVYVLKSLSVEEIRAVIDQAMSNTERGLGKRPRMARNIYLSRYWPMCWPVAYVDSIKAVKPFTIKSLRYINPCGALTLMPHCTG